MIDQINLTREAEVLHRQFFQSEASHGLIDNYIKCHTEIPDMAQFRDSELCTVQIIIKKELDALGIEPWLRTGSVRHLLSRKLLLIAYLAECDATHPQFRREVKGRVRSLVHLISSSTLAIFHLVKGLFQKIIYGLL